MKQTGIRSTLLPADFSVSFSVFSGYPYFHFENVGILMLYMLTLRRFREYKKCSYDYCHDFWRGRVVLKGKRVGII